MELGVLFAEDAPTSHPNPHAPLPARMHGPALCPWLWAGEDQLRIGRKRTRSGNSFLGPSSHQHQRGSWAGCMVQGICSAQFSLLWGSCDSCPVTPLSLQRSQSCSIWPRFLHHRLASPAPCPQALDLIRSISFPRIILLQEGHLPPPGSWTTERGHGRSGRAPCRPRQGSGVLPKSGF